MLPILLLIILSWSALPGLQDKVYVKSITFVGNRTFSQDELKRALEIKESDLYDSLKLEAYLDQNIRRLYQEHGHLRVQIGQPIIRIEGKEVHIEIPIVEGEQYRLGELKIVGASVFDAQTLLELFEMKPGDVVNFTKIRNALETIRKMYGSRGYINWNYIPKQDIDPAARTFNFALEFDEGQQYRVRRIDIAGNTSARDRTIRETLLLDEGDVFNFELLEQSIARLNQLGIFKEIKESDFEVRPDKETPEVDIFIRLHDKAP